MNTIESEKQEYDSLMEAMDNYQIPKHCQSSLAQYIMYHTTTGSFLENLLSNNLKETFASADDINYKAIGNYVKFLYNCAPSACWGSSERYLNWIKKGDQNGTP